MNGYIWHKNQAAKKNKEMQHNRFGIFLTAMLFVILLGGCGKVSVKEEKLKDVEYSVTSADELPKELLEVIESKKQAPFKLTFQDKDCLYICRGYGEKPGCGYSISMEAFYETANALYLKTTLIGPGEEEIKTDRNSCPYIVVKCEYTDKTVVFD